MQYHQPHGCTAEGTWTVRSSMEHTSLRVLHLAAGGAQQVATGGDEILVVPLSGGCVIETGTETVTLSGRPDVFSGVSDFAYLPRETTARLSSAGGGRFALAGAPAHRALPLRRCAAQQVPVELRGAGACSRQVNNLAPAGGFACDRLMVVEVLTPGGNWSSFPPHKHDEHSDEESELEEIYYFEIADGGAGYQRVSGTADRPIDVLAEVRTGDVVLVPHGWHGPSMATPGYHMYYLNVMAGPHDERSWRIRDEPSCGWIRQTWQDQPVDPRLPLTRVAP